MNPLDLLIAEGAGKDHELVDAAAEEAHGRLVEVRQRVGRDARRDGQRRELARHIQTHTIADFLELEPLLAGPATSDPSAANDGAVVARLAALGLVAQGLTPGFLALERVVD